MNRILQYLPFVTLIMFMACTDRVEPRMEEPDGLINRDSMVAILVDLHLTEAALFDKQSAGYNTEVLKYDYYRAVLDKHGISREQFESSYRYYQDDLESFDKLYMDVVNALSRMQSATE